jgi:protein SCO1/2
MPLVSHILCRRSFVALAGGALALLAALAFAACGGDRETGDDAATEPVTALDPDAYWGVQVLPPIPKPGFVLTDTEGNDFDLVADTEGSVTLLYLGYTNCPDICPTHMLDIKRALADLPEDVRADIKVVFVTTDPARDTPQVMRRWLDAFDPSFIGLTGDQETIDALQRSVGIIPATTTDLGGGNYAVNHAAYVMAFTPDNLAHLVYPYGIEREAWTHDLEKLVREGWTES